MKLVYIPKAGFSCPGDGWPAADHDEPDNALAKRKVASGWYTLATQKRETKKEVT